MAENSQSNDLPHILAEKATATSGKIYGDQLQGLNIRLLRLLPGRTNEQLQCHLIEACLDDLPCYEALSYVWGWDKETILCNGRLMEISSNLAQVLRRLREKIDSAPTQEPNKIDASLEQRQYNDVRRPPPHSAFMTLWADIICINQLDLIERNHQVQLMKEIYSRARRVIVWLGVPPGGDNQTSKAVTVIQKVHQYQTKIAEQESPQTVETIKGQSHVDLANPERGELEAMFGEDHASTKEDLKAFFQSPWWTRVWCVQESILARELWFLFGFEKVEGSSIASFTTWYHHQLWSSRLDLFLDSDRANRAMYSALVRFTYADQCSDAIFTLDSFRGLDATDARDKVYSLLGIMKQNHLKVDYSKSVAEVYADTVLQTINDRKDLQILSYVDNIIYDHDNWVEEFPSWVPRWNKIKFSRGLWPFGSTVSACRRETPTIDSALAYKGGLQLSGLYVDTVVRTSPVTVNFPEEPSDLDVELQEYILELWHEVQRCTIKTVREEDCRWLPLSLVTLATSLTGGNMVDPSSARGILHAQWVYVDEIDSDMGKQFLSDFHAFIRMLYPHSTAPKIPVDPSREDDDDERNAQVFLSLAIGFLHARRLFRTCRGYLGLGPGCMEVGDHAVVLDGGKVPYILRPRDSSGNFRFLGDCYIHDIMRGEAYDMPGVEERVFILR